MQDKSVLIERLKSARAVAREARDLDPAPQPANKLQAKRLTQIPGVLHRLFLRVWNGGNSRAEAIQGMCIQCHGYSRSGITECGDRLCPLHAFRPYQPGDTEGETESS